MNAVAAVSGAADPRAARAAVTTMLDRMKQRAGGHRLVLAETSGVAGAGGTSPAFGSMADVAALAGDLRLDNGAELRAALSLPRDAPDATVALEAFAKWGDDFADHLVGDFAFVILDRRERRLLAVRDPLGIRPLFYRPGVDHVRCASELRALVEAGDAPDEGYLAEMLTGDIADIDGTPFLSVRRVPAAHTLIATTGGIRLARYWEPSRAQHRGSLEHHAQRFREVFDEAVRARSAGLAKVGLHLSGGLDSSSILGSICANGYATPVPGSLIFPWPAADEREWIAAAANHWSIESIQVMAPSDPAPHDLGGIGDHVDIPGNPAGVPLMVPLHAALREGGAGVVLTGYGGDQWWAGDAVHMADLLRRGRLGALNRWRAGGAALGEEIEWRWGDFARHGVLPLVPRPLIRAVRHFHPAPLPPWIDSALARRVDLRARLRRRPDTSGAPSETWRRMRWRLESGEEAFAKEKFDRGAVATGVELRHPFYDKRLVELAFAMPEEGRIGPAGNRVAMRAAMRDRLPPVIAARGSKADFTQVLLSALGAPGVREHLQGRHLAEVGWVNAGAVAALADAVVSGRDITGAGMLWRIIGVEAWLKEIFGAR